MGKLHGSLSVYAKSENPSAKTIWSHDKLSRLEKVLGQRVLKICIKLLKRLYGFSDEDEQIKVLKFL